MLDIRDCLALRIELKCYPELTDLRILARWFRTRVVYELLLTSVAAPLHGCNLSGRALSFINLAREPDLLFRLFSSLHPGPLQRVVGQPQVDKMTSVVRAPLGNPSHKHINL
jgi:hypothetical protein